MVKKIILDCDPGIDDAIAILLAHGNPNIELLAITTVVGNQILEKVTHNALAIARIANITNVPIAAGCDRPLLRNIQTAPEIHGESGLGSVTLPKPALTLDPRHAIDLIIDLIMSHEPNSITLVPTAGLTNIAMAVRKEPRIVERVKEVVLMGGGYHIGNQTAVAEFNINIDPEAAHIVFNEPWQITMVGLDLTYQALATPLAMKRVAELQTTPAKFVYGLLEFLQKTNQTVHGIEYPPIHDPCAVAYVIDSSVMTTRKAPINIELSGTFTTGMTVTDLRSPPDPQCHTKVGVKLDHTYLWDLIIDALERIGEVP